MQPLCGILAFAQAPPTSATAGVALDPQPVRPAPGRGRGGPGDRRRRGHGARVSGGAATTLGSVKTDANGRATFSGLAIDGTGQFDLDFVATGYAEHVVTIDVSAGP